MTITSGLWGAGIHFRLETNANSGMIDLDYSLRRRDGDLTPLSQRIDLDTTRLHFGGLRWWFRCPITGRRARVLYLAPGRSYFASREALGLSYRSRNVDARTRAIRRAQRILRSLGADSDAIPELVQKPRGMHWSTFSRLATAARAALDAADEAWVRDAIPRLVQMGVDHSSAHLNHYKSLLNPGDAEQPSR